MSDAGFLSSSRNPHSGNKHVPRSEIPEVDIPVVSCTNVVIFGLRNKQLA